MPTTPCHQPTGPTSSLIIMTIKNAKHLHTNQPKRIGLKHTFALSPLELLACELLISIYEHSRNPSFLFASPRLHGLTQYRSIKLALITDCCTDATLTTRNNKIAIFNLRMLLHENWLSLGWLLDAAMSWAEREVRGELAGWLERHERDERRRAELWEGFTAVWDARRADYQCQVSPHVGHPQVRLGAPASSEDGNRSQNRSEFVFGVEWPPVVVVRHNGERPIAKPFVQPIDWRIFPRRLLAGPWNQTDGDILSFFLPSMRMSKRDHFVPRPARKALNGLQQGLCRALAEENIPALLCFTGEGNALSSKLRDDYLKSFEDLPTGAGMEIDTRKWSIAKFPGPNRGDFMPGGVVEIAHIDLATAKLREVRARMRRDKMKLGRCFGTDFVLQALLKAEYWHDVALYLASNEE